jgi:peroxiredoxin
MKQLREFAQHKSDFDQLHTRIVGISVDDQEHAKLVYDKQINHAFTILSDPGAKVIRDYGLVHEHGKGDEDIAIRTTLLIDEQGREQWRRVSNTVPDIPTAEEALRQIREMK